MYELTILWFYLQVFASFDLKSWRISRLEIIPRGFFGNQHKIIVFKRLMEYPCVPTHKTNFR